MRTLALSRSALMLAHAVAFTVVAGLAQAQATAPQVPPVPPAQPDPRPPVAQVPVTPPEAATAPATPAVPPAAPPDATPPAAAARQASEMARGDPVRWYKQDATEEQRLRTQRKEIDAAFEEAKRACREVEITGRSRCMKEARATHEKDLAGIRSNAGVR